MNVLKIGNYQFTEYEKLLIEAGWEPNFSLEEKVKEITGLTTEAAQKRFKEIKETLNPNFQTFSKEVLENIETLKDAKADRVILVLDKLFELSEAIPSHATPVTLLQKVKDSYRKIKTERALYQIENKIFESHFDTITWAIQKDARVSLEESKQGKYASDVLKKMDKIINRFNLESFKQLLEKSVFPTLSKKPFSGVILANHVVDFYQSCDQSKREIFLKELVKRSDWYILAVNFIYTADTQSKLKINPEEGKWALDIIDEWANSDILAEAAKRDLDKVIKINDHLSETVNLKELVLSPKEFNERSVFLGNLYTSFKTGYSLLAANRDERRKMLWASLNNTNNQLDRLFAPLMNSLYKKNLLSLNEIWRGISHRHYELMPDVNKALEAHFEKLLE
ncbi:MAG: hypothetical protein H7A37_04010 [Chlamydiales bacterium]|nr:hypothetical protein [Chlamydiales bacterium]